MPQILETASQKGFQPFFKLVSLKLRGTSLNDNALALIIAHTPNLHKLDISFTAVRTPYFNKEAGPIIPPLEKLSITQIPVSQNILLAALPHFPLLKKLHMGQLNVVSQEATTVTDAFLWTLTDVLVDLRHLEQINLVANGKLGLSGPKGGGALADFITRVGRRCTVRYIPNASIIPCLNIFAIRP
jgi:hypothetical protein